MGHGPASGRNAVRRRESGSACSCSCSFAVWRQRFRGLLHCTGSARRATLAPPHPDTRQKQRQNTQPPTQWRTRAQHTTAPQHTSTAPHPTTSCVLLHVARGHRLHRATTPPAQHPACTTWLDRRSEIKSPRPYAKITSVTHSPLHSRQKRAVPATLRSVAGSLPCSGVFCGATHRASGVVDVYNVVVRSQPVRLWTRPSPPVCSPFSEPRGRR